MNDHTVSRRRIIPMAGVMLILAMALGACGTTASHHVSTAPGSPPPPSENPVIPTPALPHSTHIARIKRSHLPADVLAEIRFNPALTTDYVDGPTAMVAGFGSLWIESHRASFLVRINPKTDAVQASIDLNQDSCGRPAVGYGRVFVQPCDDSTKTIVINPKTNQVVGSFHGGGDMAFADGSLWVPRYDQKAVERINPRTLKREGQVRTFGDEVVYDGRHLWSLDVNGENQSSHGILTEIDPHTSRIIGHIHTPVQGAGKQSVAGPGPDVTYADGALFLTGDGRHAQLVRVDLTTRKSSVHELPDVQHSSFQYDERTPAVGLGSIWVRASNTEIARIDPATGSTTATYRGDQSAFGGYVYIAFGSLWTSNFADNSLWRIRVPTSG